MISVSMVLNPRKFLNFVPFGGHLSKQTDLGSIQVCFCSAIEALSPMCQVVRGDSESGMSYKREI